MYWLGLGVEKHNPNSPLTVKMVRLAGEKERRLYSRMRLRVVVDSIAADGRTLICTVFQARKAPLAKPLDTLEMVQHAEAILAPLLGAGYRPMITAVDWAHAGSLRNASERPDRNDPLGLVAALKESGSPFPRLNAEKGGTSNNDLLPLPLWRKALGFFA